MWPNPTASDVREGPRHQGPDRQGRRGLKFTIHHGAAHQYANFTDVLNATRDFLRETRRRRRRYPPAPTNLKVRAIDAPTVELDWSGSTQAAGYRVWVRNINDGSIPTADEWIIQQTNHTVAYLFPERGTTSSA